jgi:hypothetical protein
LRLRHFFLVLVLFLSVKANAQIGIYGTFSGSHLGGIRPPYPYSGNYGFWTAGGTFGAYDDFAHLGPARLGIDARGSILDTHGHKLNSALAGVRFAFKAPALPIRPYVQASAGIGNTNYGGGSVTSNGFQYQIFGGLDFTFLPRLDWRVLEIGAGALHTNGSNYPVETLSTGIVFRLP